MSASTEQERVETRLRELAECPDGWAGDGKGLAPTVAARDKAKTILLGMQVKPGIFPTLTGGISCEWVIGNACVELVVEPDGSFGFEATEVEVVVQ